ncbi:hypothetical protein [Pseudonocardia ailaonensis]|uniref:hypothetical protein n=1 Tax=Pseudonocardia ailaonensis TaxID=367279 RepID=UPI0031D9CF0A
MHVLDFTVQQITEPRCDSSSGREAPKNGRLVSLKVDAVSKDDPNNVLPAILFGAGWEFVGADGRSVEASTTAAAICHYDAPQIKPNRTYSFDVVLDVPKGQTGVLVFDPARNGGWEWALTT